MAKKPKEKPEMVAFSLRVPKDLYDRIVKLSEAEGRSLNKQAARLLQKAV
jgi:hypothetical protein